MIDYNRFINNRAASLKPSGIRKFFDIVSQRKDAISLGVGEPDFGTPWAASESAIRAIRNGMTHYTSNAGLIELRRLISKYYLEHYSVEYDPESEIIATIGASEGIDLAMRALVSEGDEVLIASPSYVSYEPCVRLAGGVPVPVECYAEAKFRITPDNLEKAVTRRSKLLLLPYPNNPTGAIMERGDLEAIAPVIKRHDLMVLSDEIYSELVYNGKRHVSIASLEGMRERCVVLNGFSKAFAMTGWRLGYLMAPHEVCNVIYKIHQYGIMCAPTMSQFAGVQALSQAMEDGFAAVSEMRDEYDKRRRFLVKELNAMGLSCFEPEGAFYVFPSVRSLGMTGDEFAEKLLDSQNVAVVPGSAFGESGRDYVRISYAYSLRSIDTALKRIAGFVDECRACAGN